MALINNRMVAQQLNALIGNYDGAMNFGIDGAQVLSNDVEFINANDGKLSLFPHVESGVCFVYTVVSTDDRSFFLTITPKTSVALYRDGAMILCWAFESPSPLTEDLKALMEFFQMKDLEEAIPLSVNNGWEMIHCNAETFYNLSDLLGAFLYPSNGPVLARFGQAIIQREYDPARYSHDITVTACPNKESMHCVPRTMTVNNFIKSLCVHAQGKKDGPGFVLGDLVPGRRLKTAVKSLTGVGLDIDVGTDPRDIDAKVAGLNCLAIRYTTHSNGSTNTLIKRDEIAKYCQQQLSTAEPETDEAVQSYLRHVKRWDEKIVVTASFDSKVHNSDGIFIRARHVPIPKNRIILPFAVPFEIAKVATTQAEALRLWPTIPLKLAEKLGLPLDKSGTDPARLFFAPRHPVGGSFEIALWGGPLFDWQSLESSPFEEIAREFGSKPSKSSTPAGQALGRWWVKRAHGFQLADVVNDLAPEMIRGPASHGGHSIQCPFDDHHGNAGDPNDRACFVVNAAAGPYEFCMVRCQHDGCKNKTTLDMVGKMIADRWFDRSILDDESYNAILDDSGEQPAESMARLDVDALLASLPKNPSSDAVESALETLAASDPSALQVEAVVTGLYEKTGIGKKVLRVTFDEKRPEKGFKAAVKTSDAIVRRIEGAGSVSFQYPDEHFGVFGLTDVGGRPWLVRLAQGSEKYDQRLCTPIQLIGGVTYIDRDHAQGKRVAVFDADDKWRFVDIESKLFAHSSAAEAMGKLFSAGMAVTPEGRNFVVNYLAESQKRGADIYDRPGFRGDSFISPTGEVLLGDRPMELNPEMRLTCEARAGTLAGWKEAAARLYRISNAVPHQAGVLMGLAGTLANLAGDDPLGYSLEGETTTGKSTIQMISVGHWADPKLGAGLFIGAKGTENSQEYPLQRATGTVVALDEVSNMPPNAIQELLFLNQGGTGKRRLNAHSEERKARKWGGLSLIISAETSFAQRLATAGIPQAGGLSVRVLPILTSADTRIPENDWDAIMGLIGNFGWSGPAFVEALDRQGFVQNTFMLRELISVLTVQLPGTSGTENAQRYRAARLVAYLWAAGKIAIDADLLPKDFEIEKLALRLWRDALSSEIAPENTSALAVRKLLERLVSSRGVDIIDIGQNDRTHREAVGYYNVLIQGEAAYVIRAEKLVELGGGNSTKRAMLKVLRKGDYLILPQDDDSNTWSGFPGLGKSVQYAVLKAAKVEM